MISTGPHIIVKQVLEVRFNGTEQAGLEFQRHAMDFMLTSFQPKLDVSMNQVAGPDEYITIERVDIEMEEEFTIERTDWFSDTLVKKVHDAVAEKIANFYSKENSTHTEVRTSEQHAVDILIYFLEHGRLPWFIPIQATSSLEKYITGKLPVFMLKKDQLFKLDMVLKNEIAQKRLLNTFSDSFTNTVINQVLRYQKIDIKQKLETLEKIAFLSKSNSNSLHSQIQNKSSGMTGNSAFQNPKRGDQKTPPVHTSMSFHQTDHILSTTSLPAINIEEGIFINNAGLVLLHPFLTRLFEALHISKDNNIIDLPFALQVLHFIHSGDTNLPEYDLVLPKILCGLPVDQYVDLTVEWNTESGVEAERMISASIGHWEALRNTSVEGFRETFLNRPGKLVLSNDLTWNLFVEVRTFDILMNYLPWGFGMIQLPWMPGRLQVQWDYQQLS